MFGEISTCALTEFRHTPQIGRNHGIHPSPITFGLKIANWSREISAYHTLPDAAEQMAVGKFSAPSAMLRTLARKWRAHLQRLGLSVAPLLHKLFSATAMRNISAPSRSSPYTRKNRARNSPSATYRSPRG